MVLLTDGSMLLQTIGLLIAAVVVNATKDTYGPECYRIPIAIQVRSPWHLRHFPSLSR